MSKIKNKKLLFALECLEKGQPIAIPTETVYGLAASCSHPFGIRNIFAIKGRPNNHPLLIHVDSIDMAEKYSFFSPLAKKIAQHFWPGPLALILPKKEVVPFEVTGGLQTVGIRCPNHSTTLKLIQSHGYPLAAPSANQFGKISPTKASHVIDDYQGEVPVLDGGDCTIGLESTILDLSGNLPCIRRPGAITEQDLAPFITEFGHTNTKTSGTHKAHYAPSTSLHLCDHPEKEKETWERKGLSVATLSIYDEEQYAQKLYSELRRLDKLGVDILLASIPSNKGIGLAVLDRLNRASFGSNQK